ncbi:MAG: PEPxxWA-CTERM sorting domain-containing protein [Caulobacteraceae bacterium]
MKIALALPIALAFIATGAARASVVTTASVSGTSVDPVQATNGTWSDVTRNTIANPLEAIHTYTWYNGSAVPEAGDLIAFANGAAAAAFTYPANLTVSARSSTHISQSIVNDTGVRQQVNLHSLILGGAFGMFVAKTPGDPNGFCTNASVASCNALLDGATSLQGAGTYTSGFTVDVKLNGHAIYSLSAGLILNSGGFTANVADAATRLAGFHAEESNTDGGAAQKFYAWSDTPMDSALGVLAVGASETLTYDVTTYGTGDQPALNNLQVMFAEFGDPLGGGHVVNNVLEPIVDFPAPAITFTPAPAPEPATWALLLVGFGLAGASLRRGTRNALGHERGARGVD